MAEKYSILGRLKPFQNKRNLILNNQNVPDIMKAMLNAHSIYASEYDKICMDFYAGSDIASAKKVYNFLKDHIKYTIDSENNQQIMSPAGILSIGKNDCKNYALFIVGVLDGLKRKGMLNGTPFFRFASYRMFDEMPHHVFAVLKTKNGKEIFIDPVLPTFNNRKKYFHKIDKLPNMAMYSVSGLDNQIGLFKSKKNKAAAAAQASTESGQKAAAAAAAVQSKGKKKIVLKIALAPSRGAFLSLVGLNFMGLATKLKKAFDDHADKTASWWKNLGGNPNELLRKTNQGSVKKRLLGADVYFPSEGQIGEPATAAAATTAAAPILIKVAEFLKSIGVDPKEVLEAGKEVLARQIKTAVDKNLTQEEIDQQLSDAEVNKVVDDSVKSPGSETNYLPYILGGGLAIVLLTKMGKK